MKILITGGKGLIGTAISSLLKKYGHEVVSFDIKNSANENICDMVALRHALEGIEGVIHLAAVSRVVTAQNNPDLCINVNQIAFKNLINMCLSSTLKPWVMFSSSREVYGEQAKLPVSECSQLSPLNVYAKSKVFGETLMLEARQAGLQTNTFRLSNVYGDVNDHHNRVIPAFARASAFGGELRVEGEKNTFDFTHVNDVAKGICKLVELTIQNELLPTIHFCSGTPTTLGELADLAISLAKNPTTKKEYPSRNYDVARFYGDTSLAKSILGWKHTTQLRTGLGQLINDFFKIN